MTWEGHERREHFYIPPEIVEGIAEKAAERAVEKMKEYFYAEIGKGVVSVGKGVMVKIYWLVGALIMGLSAWLASKGLLK